MSAFISAAADRNKQPILDGCLRVAGRGAPWNRGGHGHTRPGSRCHAGDLEAHRKR